MEAKNFIVRIMECGCGEEVEMEAVMWKLISSRLDFIAGRKVTKKEKQIAEYDHCL